MVAAHTALDYLRALNHQRKREVNLDDLSQKDLMQLTTVDRYPSDSSVFRFREYELTIDNDDVAEAFSKLSVEAQSILILRFAMDMTDQEIGASDVNGSGCLQGRSGIADNDPASL